MRVANAVLLVKHVTVGTAPDSDPVFSSEITAKDLEIFLPQVSPPLFSLPLFPIWAIHIKKYVYELLFSC